MISSKMASSYYKLFKPFAIIILLFLTILALDVSFANTSSVSTFSNNGQILSTPTTHLEFIYLDYNIGGDVTRNSEIVANIPKTRLSSKIFEMEKKGSVVVKSGNGGNPVLLVCAGIHGNEEEANIAAMKYLEFVKDQNFNGTLYIIPFALPKSTAKNSRYYNGQDPNRIANYPGTPGYNIIRFALKNKVQYILDLHSGGEVGSKGLIIYTKPCYPGEKNWLNFIKDKTGCNALSNSEAGRIRTVAHKAGINTITLEAERDTILTSLAAKTEYKLLLAACKFLGFPTPGELKIKSIDPFNGAASVPLNKTIVVTFNANIFAGPGYNKITVKTSTGTTKTIIKWISGNKLYIKATGGWSPGVKFIVTIPKNAVKNSLGSMLATDFKSSFTVAR